MSTLPFAQRRTPAPPPVADDDGLLEFASEAETAAKAAHAAVTRQRTTRAGIAVAAVIVVAGGAWAARSFGGAANGTLTIETDPAGISVRIDNIERGRTPVSLSLAPGNHDVQLERDGTIRHLSAAVARSATAVHHVVWAPSAPPVVAAAPAAGALKVVTDPVGASIEIDGVARGASPVSLENLAPGEHRVVVRRGAAVSRRTVTIEAGVTASLVVSMAPSSTSGWMTVSSPIALQIYEDGTLIGTSEASRIMLPAGNHDLEFASSALGFRTRKAVDVAAERTTTVAVPLERAPISVNAVPWAEVWIDGAKAGETPLAAIMTTIGPHMVEFRHPELGRKTIPVQVSLKEPTRVSVDMRTK